MRRLLVIQDPDEMARQLQSAGVRRAATAIGRGAGSLPDGVIRFQPAGNGSGICSSIGSSIGFPALEKVNEEKRKAETEAILRALDACRWNRKQAAKILEIDYKALLYKMRKLDIDQSGVALRSAAGGA
jgi:two-component system response regulator AtoC